MTKSKYRNKPVKCLNDGIVYDTITQAAANYGIYPASIRRYLNGEAKKGIRKGINNLLKFEYEGGNL